MAKWKITGIDQVSYEKISLPQITAAGEQPEIPACVYGNRIRKLTELLAQRGLDGAVIYADREHHQNFEYFFGIDIWFEEAVGIVWKDGTCAALLGNECLPLTIHAKVPLRGILCPVLSLPGQPMQGHTLDEGFQSAGVQKGQKLGCAGWKQLDSEVSFDLPAFILESLRKGIGEAGSLVNITKLLAGPGTGIRNYVEAEQAAVFAYAAEMVSNGMLAAWEKLEEGATELEVGSCFNPKGLPLSCHSNVSSGIRTRTGLVSPSDKRMEKGDPVTLCWAMRGGLSCRAGYLAEGPEDLPELNRDYCEKVVKPYFAAAVTWYENIGIGVTGGEIYELVEQIFPKEQYGWSLNPGHGLASEEWLNSPVFKGSQIPFCSGQMIQLDIIPEPGYGYATSNIEDGILLADEQLRTELREKYPEIWGRIQYRRQYMAEELGIHLKEEVLPLYNTQGILNPYLLKKGYAMKKVSFNLEPKS